MRKHCRQLDAKDLGRQDHATSPSAPAPIVSRHLRVHRIPASRVVTIAIRPSSIEAGGDTYTANPNFGKEKYFCARGLTAIRTPARPGKSVAQLRETSAEFGMRL